MSLTLPGGRQVLHWLGLLLLLVVVIPFIIYAVPGLAGADGSYVVLSGSMEPSIGVGDVVIVDEADPATIEEGDVITYRPSGAETPTTHRVVEITEREGELAFLTQGDANDQPDAAPVPASQVIGEVAVTFPYMGYVIAFVNTLQGFIALVVVPLLLLLISEVRSLLASNEAGPKEVDGGKMMENGVTSGTNPKAVSGDPMGPVEEADVIASELNGVAVDPSFKNLDNGMVGSSAKPVRNLNAGFGVSRIEDAVDTVDDGTIDDTIAITRTDLRLSLAVLIGVTIYAGWVVYNIQKPWSFAVAYGSGVGTLLVGGMYYVAGSSASSEATNVTDNGETPVPPSEYMMKPNPNVRTDGASTVSIEPDPGMGEERNAKSEDNDG